jgi:hypothetical protein
MWCAHDIQLIPPPFAETNIPNKKDSEVYEMMCLWWFFSLKISIKPQRKKSPQPEKFRSQELIEEISIFTIKKTQNKPSREKNLRNHNSLKGNMTMNADIKPYENCTQSVRWHHHHLHRE